MTTQSTIPEFALQDLCSESAALRILNLATSRRDWLRSKLTGTPAGSAMIYKGNDVLALFRQLQADPSLLSPPAAARPIPSGLQHSGPTDAGTPSLPTESAAPSKPDNILPEPETR